MACRLVTALALVLALPACGEAPHRQQPATAAAQPSPAAPATPPANPAPPNSAPADPAPANPAADPALHRAMHGELLRAVAIRDAVISGELADTRAPARDLLDTALTVPDAWRPHVEAMQKAAREILDAADITVAAAATGRLARQCGHCHATTGARHDMTFPAAPPVAPGARPSMLLHQWAAERLYQGLITNNDAAWQAGAAALVDAPLHMDEVTADVELPEELHGLATKVHALGGEAKGATDPDVRARLYGDLLASCAACHKGGC